MVDNILNNAESVSLGKNQLCPVCGSHRSNEKYDICPVCGWERDPVQEADPNFKGGANKLSLNEAIEKYAWELEAAERQGDPEGKQNPEGQNDAGKAQK